VQNITWLFCQDHAGVNERVGSLAGKAVFDGTVMRRDRAVNDEFQSKEENDREKICMIQGRVRGESVPEVHTINT